MRVIKRVLFLFIYLPAQYTPHPFSDFADRLLLTTSYTYIFIRMTKENMTFRVYHRLKSVHRLANATFLRTYIQWWWYFRPNLLRAYLYSPTSHITSFLSSRSVFSKYQIVLVGTILLKKTICYNDWNVIQMYEKRLPHMQGKIYCIFNIYEETFP